MAFMFLSGQNGGAGEIEDAIGSGTVNLTVSP
jgi:hypothetical protein